MKAFFSANILRWVGLVITGLAVGLVVWSLYTSDLLASEAWKDPDVLVAVVIAAVIFLPSLFCVAAAWYLLISSVSKVHISRLEAYSIYAISAIYRYIPSNVLHYVARHYLLRKRGVEHSVSAWVVLSETALFISASAAVALAFGAPLIQEALLNAAHDNWLLVAFAILAVTVLAGTAVRVVRSRGVIRDLFEPFLRTKVLIAGLAAFAFQVAARIISGLALWWLVVQLLGSGAPSPSDIIAIWATAWLLGYITPGASAGLGVREAVIIALLSGLGVPIAGATLIAIAFRVTTTIGDLIFSGSGWVLRYFIEARA